MISPHSEEIHCVPSPNVLSSIGNIYDSEGNLLEVSHSASIALATWADGRVDSEGTPINTSVSALPLDLGHGFSTLDAFAYGLDPSSHELTFLSEFLTDTSGLPYIHLTESGPDAVLEVEHLRRKGVDELGYQIEFSSNLIDWEAPENEETITNIDDTWERIALLDHETSSTHNRRFGRVKLSYEPERPRVEGLPPTPDNAFVGSLTPTIAWSGTGFETEYDFELSQGAPGSPLPDYTGTLPMPWAQIAPDRPLEDGTEYFWRFREVEGTWSDWQSFTTPPGATTPLSPNEEQVDSRIPNYTWQATPGASIYEWQIARGSANANEFLGERTTPNTSFPDAHLAQPYSTEFAWRVRAGNPQGAYGPWSDWLGFSTPIQLLAPANSFEAFPRADPFRWTPMTTRPNRLQIAWDSNFSGLFFNEIVSGGSKSFPEDETGFPPDTRLYWRVGADFPNGTRWSSVRNFRTSDLAPLAAPVITAPRTNIVSRTPSLKWQAIPADAYIASYEVVVERQIGQFPDPNNREFHWSIVVPHPTSGSEVKTRIPLEAKLEFLSAYYWKVRGISGDGHPGPWAVETIPLAPSNEYQPRLRVPNNLEGNQSRTLTLKWRDDLESGTWVADGYRVQIFTDAQLENRIHNATVPNGQTQYTVPSGVLNGSTTYYWRVKGLGEDRFVFSSYRGFITQ